MSGSRQVLAGWARVDDDELWARWTNNWPRWPKGVGEDGEEMDQEKAMISYDFEPLGAPKSSFLSSIEAVSELKRT